MKGTSNRKGFTIVELVIVIAVIGILTAVLIPTFIGLVDRAQRAENETFVRNINTQLAVNEAAGERNPNMYEAVKDAQAMGFLVDQITPYNGNDIIWDSVHDRFAIVKANFADSPSSDKVVYADGSFDVNTPLYKLWKAYPEMPTGEQTYSIYAKKKDNWASAPFSVSVGFDVGENTNLNKITYARSGEDTHKVGIRTSGGTLTINAALDEVVHYGQADYVDVIAVKPTSYEEEGKTSLVKVKYGNIALSSKSNVGEIHMAATDGQFTSIKVTLTGTTKLPELSRDSVGTALAGEVFVCEVNKNGTSEFYWLSGNGTIEDGKVLVSSTKEGEKTAAAETNETAVAIANTKVGTEVTDSGKALAPAADMTEDQIVKATKSGASNTFKEIGSKEELVAFRDAWNEGKLEEGATYKLTANINISGEPWAPIGNQAHPFNGTLDGNGKTIEGLSNEGYSIDVNAIFTTDHSLATGAPYGLFGVVGSINNNTAAVSIKDLTLTKVNINDDMFSCVGSVIGGDVGSVKQGAGFSSDDALNPSFTGNITVQGVTVSGTKVYGVDGVGGIIGKIYSKGDVEVTSCTSSIDVYAVVSTNKKAAALVGYANGGASYNISGNTISGNVYSRNTKDYLIDQVANIKKVQLNYIFGVGDNTCTNKIFLKEGDEYVEYKMPYVISHERNANGQVIHSIVTYMNEAEPNVHYLPDNRQDLCDGTIVLNMDDSIYGHFFTSYSTLSGSIEFRNCVIGTNMKQFAFTNTTSVLFKDCDIIAGSGDGIYMILKAGTLALDLGTHTSHRTVQICTGGDAENQQCAAGTEITVLSGTYTNTIYNHGAENGVINIEGGTFTFAESQYGLDKTSGRGDGAFFITGGTYDTVCGLDSSRHINVAPYVPATHEATEVNGKIVVLEKQNG